MLGLRFCRAQATARCIRTALVFVRFILVGLVLVAGHHASSDVSTKTPAVRRGSPRCLEASHQIKDTVCLHLVDLVVPFGPSPPPWSFGLLFDQQSSIKSGRQESSWCLAIINATNTAQPRASATQLSLCILCRSEAATQLEMQSIQRPRRRRTSCAVVLTPAPALPCQIATFIFQSHPHAQMVIQIRASYHSQLRK